MFIIRKQTQSKINMFDGKIKWDLTEINKNDVNKGILKKMLNQSIVNSQNIKTFTDFVKTQSDENMTKKFNNFENNNERQQLNYINGGHRFAINPLNDLRNSSPLNDKIGKFRGRNITLIYEVNLKQIYIGDLVNIAFDCEINCPQCNLEGICFENCKLCKGVGRFKGTRRTQLSIPAGIKFGDIVKFKALGEAGLKGAACGDLYIKFELRSHEFYVKLQNTIYCRIPISVETLMMGGKINITLPSGNKTTLRLLPSNNCYYETLYTKLGLYESTGCVKDLIVKFELFVIGKTYIPSTHLFIYIDKFNKTLLEQNIAKHDNGN
ncbi:MAG: DnaJ C-terminal domain-containing protein [Candidatus Hodgkinia cicadicola]